jgi:radical SAM enzyme (TIGR01210 family)
MHTRPAIRYPDTPSARTRWILAQRGAKNTLDPYRPYAQLREEEPDETGCPLPTLTVFLTNRECPWRCLMCDLWQNTLNERVPPGAIPAQIRHALKSFPEFAGLSQTERGAQIKLYNAGSFFDPNAIPPEDYPEIAALVAPFRRVIVECHPTLIGKRCLALQDMLRGTLEVAIGLETAHPETLARLNKRFTIDEFQSAADLLQRSQISLRVFLLLRPPFQSEEEGVFWAKRSLEVAFDSGAAVCCLIPTRDGNGAMERLAEIGDYAPPSLHSLEAAVEHGIALQRGRVFADLWDIERFHTCACSPARAARLEAINRTQRLPAPVECARCSALYSGEVHAGC